MPLVSTALKPVTWYAFTLNNIAHVPSASGVYWLGLNNRVIYIGSSSDLHGRLSDHYGSNDPCIRKANQFAIDICSNYRERERQLLQAYLSKYGHLPECNDRI